MLFNTFLCILGVAAASRATTCGYEAGDPQSARTAQSGYACRVDTANGLWGFCPTTVISAQDCGLAGYCVDSHLCTEGCGRLYGRADITTFSCARSQFCSTALLINGPDQSFEYIACGAEARTDSLFPAANIAGSTISSSRFTSMDSISVTGPASRQIATVVETSSVPASTSNYIANPTSTSSLSDPISTPSMQQPMNLGPIVGGAVGGLIVICLTVLGIVLIRRKHGARAQLQSQPGHGQIEFTSDPMLLAHSSEIGKKDWVRDSRHNLVELYSGHDAGVEPAELSAQVKGAHPSEGADL